MKMKKILNNQLKIGDVVYLLQIRPARSETPWLPEKETYTIRGFCPGGGFNIDPDIKSISRDNDRYGVDIGATDRYGAKFTMEPYALFLTREDAMCAAYLIERADFEQEYGDIGGEILDRYCNGDLELGYKTMKYLLRFDQPSERRALIDAAKNGDLDSVKNLVEQGANIHTDDGYALKLAAGNGHPAVVKYLVEQGADSHKRGDMACLWAAMNGHWDIVKYLVEQGADGGDATRRLAAENGHLEIVEFLKNKEK